MKDIISEARCVYIDEGKKVLLTKGLRKLLRPLLGTNQSNKFYYALNRFLRYRSTNTQQHNIYNNNVFLTDKDYNIFFGYYDHTPFCFNNRRVLFNRTREPIQNVENSSKLELCYVNLPDLTVNKFGETETWNWQKGCRLRWYPQHNDVVVYNKIVNEGYGSVLHNVETNEIIREYDYPIYDVDPQGKFALSINFSRLERLHYDYGYSNYPDYTKEINTPSDDGIYLMDMESGETDLIVSYETISEITCSPPEPHDYVMNITINPTGEKFCFLHRYYDNGQRITNLLTATIDGQNITVLQREGEASHQIWQTSDVILSTVNRNNTTTRTDYILYDTCSGETSKLDRSELNKDTHPHFSPIDKDILVGDTYPDSCGERHLFITNVISGEKEIIGSFYGPVFNRIKRDLHPRWDRRGKFICVDVPVSNNRQSMCLINVEELVKNISIQ